MGGINNDHGRCLTTDNSGNMIIGGLIDGDADINGDDKISSGLPETSMTVYGNGDISLSKFDNKGNFLWSKRLGGNNYDTVKSVTTDSNNNIIIAGQIIDDVDLNGDGLISPGYPETRSGFFGSNDIIISKFDPNGNFIWSKRLGGGGIDLLYGITCDKNDNILFVGCIDGNVDLNGDQLISSGLPETASVIHLNLDAYVAKFDHDGNYIWANRIGGVNNDYAYGISIDTENNVIISGHSNGNTDLNCNGTIEAGLPETASGIHGDTDIMVIKFDYIGNFIWAKRLGGLFGDAGFGLTTDNKNNVIVTGVIYNNSDLDGDGSISPGIPETSSGTYGNTDIYISKFDTDGNFIWAKRLGGTDYDSDVGGDGGAYVTTDSYDNVIFCGSIIGNADVNGDGLVSTGLPETSSGTYGSSDILISKFDSTGKYGWSKRIGGGNQDHSYNIKTDINDNIFISGSVEVNADFNGNGSISSGFPETATGIFGSSFDIFVAKFGPNGEK